LIAESEFRENSQLSVIPFKLSADQSTTFLFKCSLLFERNEAAERGRGGSWFACSADKQINQVSTSVLIRGLWFTAVVVECYLLANGIFCLETLLIDPLPFSSGRVSGCKAMSGEGQGEECFVNSAWDLEQGSNFPNSKCSATQCRLLRMVMSGDIRDRSDEPRMPAEG
jgi:hypothetical protein